MNHVERFARVMAFEPVDRPCIAVRASNPEGTPAPVAEPADDEARWLDPECRVALARRELDPALLMLDTWCPSRDDGERLLEQGVVWAIRQ